MKEQKVNKGINIFINCIFLVTVLLAIGFSYYKYYYAKDFDYRVEAACDPATETCFQRDCENDPNSCPPNGLDYYKVYLVKAYDFPKCSDNSCSEQCATGAINCVPVTCGEGDECETD